VFPVSVPVRTSHHCWSKFFLVLVSVILAGKPTAGGFFSKKKILERVESKRVLSKKKRPGPDG